MNRKCTSYFLILSLCFGLLCPFTSAIFETLSPDTTIDPIIPYQITSSYLNITATNKTAVDNITLYYRYSANNYSDWCPGKDYAILTAGDYKTKTDDFNIDYPQRMWYDEQNQLLYVVNYLQDNLQVWDVSDSNSISKISQLKNLLYLDYVHDVVVVNNWSYRDRNYGNIAFTLARGSPMYFNSIRVNLSTTPEFLQNFELSRGESYTKLGYISVIQRGDCLYAAISRLSGKFNIFNVTDPTNIVNMSFVRGVDVAEGHDCWWWLTFSADTNYLYLSGDGTNVSTITFDVSDLSNPLYVGYQGEVDEWLCLIYNDRHNASTVYSISRVGIAGDENEYIKVFDASNPASWELITASGDTQNNGEWQTDFWTNDWAASRKYIYNGNQTGIILWNIRNLSDIYKAGTFARNDYTKHSHMQWLDYNKSRIFALAYASSDGGNSIYIVKWQISLAQESSWYEYGVDTSAPWSWNFSFPKGPGYYEFCSIGRKTGQFPESYPVSADSICYVPFVINTPPVFGTPTPMNNSINQPFSLIWSIPISDSEGDAFHWTIECSNGQTNHGAADINGTKSLELTNLTYFTTYTVWVNATDPDGSQNYTRAWYSFMTLQKQSNPPDKPNKPSGETSGKLNTPYTYSTSTIDPEGDMVFYLWDWGDGTQSDWLGPYNSSDTVHATHTWTVKSSSVKVKAKDISDAESPWSDPLPITMSKSSSYLFREVFLQIFKALFERFPNTLPALRQLLGV